jgi:hypothetical protein
VAREKVEAVVVQRRSGYDDAMVRANQMAISIGARRATPGSRGSRPRVTRGANSTIA